MKKNKTNCIVCWKKIAVSFDPPIKSVECIELICCDKKSRKKKHVLVVDDEQSISTTIKRFLEKLDIEVITSTTSYQALGKIKSGTHFDLVISDYNLRETLGLTFLYKTLLLKPTIKTILMSGSNFTSNEISQMNINGYLQKPFELKELKSVVQKVLEN